MPAVCQASNASNAARQLRAGTRHCPLLLRAFKPAVCQASNASNAALQLRHSGHCPLLLRAFKLPFARPQMPQTLRGSFEQALRPLPSVVKGVQACRLPGLKCLKRCAAASSRHSGHCPLLLSAFKPAVCQASNASNAARQLRAGTPATASVVKGVQACRLPGLKCLKRCAAASSRHSGHCPLLLRTFKPAVCGPKFCGALCYRIPSIGLGVKTSAGNHISIL